MKRFLLVLAVVAVFVVAGVGYWIFGTSTQIKRSVMSRLAVRTTGIAGFESNPYVHGVQQFASVPSQIVSEDAARDPAKTGVYAVAWKAPKNSGNADLLIEILPTSSDANTARHALQHEYATKKDYSSAGLTLLGKFSIPQIPGVFASSFVTSSKGATPTFVDTMLFRVGRVAVSAVVQDTKRSAIDQDATQFAVSEMRVLDATEPAFSMSSQVHQPLTALWFVLGALGVSAAVVAAPPLLRYRRARIETRADRMRRREQRHISARGGKVLKRRGGPAWQATGRHRAGQRARR
jgi:hypothetical protein